MCDAAVDADLRDLPAVRRGDFAVRVFAPAGGFAPGRRGAADLEDFLRDFLDIRLPFVAFGGSIMRPLRVLSGEPESSHQLGKSYVGKSGGAGVWLQGFRRVCSLAERAASAK